IVLGLAAPENPLSAREGIKWDDSVGAVLARRIDPTATYHGPTYEKALLVYYGKLWVYAPGEMVEIYIAKVRIATTATLEYANHVLRKHPDWRRSALAHAIPPFPTWSHGCALAGATILAIVASIWGACARGPSARRLMLACSALAVG